MKNKKGNKSQFSFNFKVENTKENSGSKEINSNNIITTDIFTKKANEKKNALYQSIVNRAKHLF